MIIVRPTIPIGPGDLNMIDVRDVALGIWTAAQHGVPGKNYLLANENWTILELFEFLSELTDRPAPRMKVPYPVALTFAYLEEWFCSHLLTKRSPMATVTGVKLTQRPLRFDGSQSIKELQLPPMRPCRDAIRETVGWFRDAGGIHPQG